MFKFLILSLLVVFLVIFMLGGLTFVTLFRKVRNINRQFGNATGTGTQQRSRHGGKTYGNAEGVSDPRTQDRRNRKIIPKDEGEYVDFVEEK